MNGRLRLGIGCRGDGETVILTPRRIVGIPCLVLLLTSLALATHAGTVRTLDGRTLSGQLRLDASDAIQVTPSNAPPERVALSNLLRADFRAPTNVPANPPSPRLSAQALDEARGALPELWQGLDVGNLERPGGAVHSHGTFTLETWRNAERDREDGFHLVCQTFRGDGEIIARVASLTPRDDKDKQARAGVVLRSSLDPEDRTLLLALTGGGGVFFRRWENRRSYGAKESRRPDLKPPYWVKLAREGNRVSAAHSTDGGRWVVFEAVEERLPERVYFGLGVMSRRRGTEATASFDHVTVRPITPRAPYTPRLVLRDGTVLADHFLALGDTLVEFSPARAGHRVLTMHVARVLLLPLDDPEALPPQRAGVLLANGDFVDCEITALKNGRAHVTSVLFGQRTYDLRKKVVALALRPVTMQPAAFVVSLQDGSVLRARSLCVTGEEAVMDTILAGPWRVPAHELQEIVRAP